MANGAHRVKGLFQFKTLRTKILIVTMLLGLLPLLIVGGALNWLFERDRYDEINTKITQHTKNISLSLEEYVDSKILGIESVAFMPSVKNAFKEYRSVIDLYGPYSSQYQEVEDKYIDIISNVTEQNGFDDVLLVSNEGLVVFSLLQGYYHGKNVFKESSENGLRVSFERTFNSIGSEVELTGYDEYEETRLIYFSSPIFEKGKYLATIIGSVHLSNYFDVLINNGLVSNYSEILFYENDGDSWKRIEYKESDLSVDNKFEKIDYLEVDGVLNTFDLKSIIPSFGLMMIVSYSEAYILEPLMRTRLLVLLFVISMAMIIALIASKVSGGITRPIKKLKESFRSLSKGEKDVYLESDLKDEVGDLLKQFNNMVKMLRNTELKLVESEKLVSIGNLAAGVAHEINNPMAIVTSNISTVKEFVGDLVSYINQVDTVIENTGDTKTGEIDKDEAVYLSQELDVTINDTAQALDRVKDIVASMQVFSEIDKENSETLSVNTLLDESILDIKKSHPDAVIENNYIKSISILGRKKQLKMVFIRLLDNAIKACEGKSANIRLHIGGTPNQAVICVDDNGCGIDTKNRDKIFDPFFTTREVGQGIGLGLAIAYSIIRAHSGFIDVQSVVGKGSRFKVVIPFDSAGSQ